MPSPAAAAASSRFRGAGRKARAARCASSPCSIRSRRFVSKPGGERTMISEPLRNPLSLFDVKDKVAIVTGASGTFGRATALALTALGGKVLLASGSKDELD